MRKVCCVFISFFLVNVVHAQSVATVNGKSISSKEFIWVYKKNHAGITTASYQELASYLNLYIDFKLKVLDAKSINLDADTAYKKEINGYEDALKAQRKALKKNAEYDFIMNEYREGVLMFNISERNIWSKVQDNDNRLKEYYAKNSNEYQGKTFDEVRGQVLGNYQEYLENEWIKVLRKKYSVKINDDEIKKLAKL